MLVKNIFAAFKWLTSSISINFNRSSTTLIIVNVWNIVKFSTSHYIWNIYGVRFFSIYNSKRRVPLFNADKLCILSTGFPLVRTFNIHRNILCIPRGERIYYATWYILKCIETEDTTVYISNVHGIDVIFVAGCLKWQFKNTYILFSGTIIVEVS